jgi:hypothetical protein
VTSPLPNILITGAGIGLGIGICLSRALGEGGGLLLARPPGLPQLGLELFHLGAKLIELTDLKPVQIDKFLAGGRLGIHDESFTRPSV